MRVGLSRSTSSAQVLGQSCGQTDGTIVTPDSCVLARASSSVGMVVGGHMDAPREVSQHSGQQPMGTPHIRRASEDDSGAIAALVPGLVPSATDDHHATFVIDGAAGPVAVLDLLQGERHLELLHLAAPDLEHARALHDFAEAAARALRAREIRLRPGAMSDEQSRALGYRNGIKRVAPDGVPLWRDGTASFSNRSTTAAPGQRWRC